MATTKQTQKQNIADVSKGTRAKLLSSLKSQLSVMTGELSREIRKLNSDSARPIHKVNDIAGQDVGSAYLQCAENIADSDVAWAVQLGHLVQDVKQLERRVLRVERMAKEVA